MDGILLADGHLDPSPVAARLTYGCKFKSTLSDIEKQFDQFHFSEPWLSKTGYWHHKSSYYRDLLCHRKRWYDGKTKIIPEDVMITPLSCYWWFVGDGYQVNYGLKFCTEAFDRQSMDIVRSKLEDLGFSTSITPSSNRLRIRGKSAPRMLDWIRSNINIAEQYTYKWGNHRKQSI